MDIKKKKSRETAQGATTHRRRHVDMIGNMSPQAVKAAMELGDAIGERQRLLSIKTTKLSLNNPDNQNSLTTTAPQEYAARLGLKKGERCYWTLGKDKQGVEVAMVYSRYTWEESLRRAGVHDELVKVLEMNKKEKADWFKKDQEEIAKATRLPPFLLKLTKEQRVKALKEAKPYRAGRLARKMAALSKRTP